MKILYSFLCSATVLALCFGNREEKVRHSQRLGRPLFAPWNTGRILPLPLPQRDSSTSIGELFRILHIGGSEQSDVDMQCDPCPGGWGLVSSCTTDIQTVCQPCGPGFWSPRESHFQKCSQCSKCGEGLYVDKPCSAYADTICDSCSTSNGRFNADFIRKCLENEDFDSDEDGNEFQSATLKFFRDEQTKGKFLPGIPLRKPSIGIPDDGIPEHEFWVDGPEELDGSIAFKPTFHAYKNPVEIMRERRIRAYIFLGATLLLLLLLIAFFVRMTLYLCRRNTQTIVNYKPLRELSEAENQIINQCARELRLKEEMGREKSEGRRFVVPNDVIDDQYWEDDPTFIHVTDNPLNKYQQNQVL